MAKRNVPKVHIQFPIAKWLGSWQLDVDIGGVQLERFILDICHLPFMQSLKNQDVTNTDD